MSEQTTLVEETSDMDGESMENVDEGSFLYDNAFKEVCRVNELSMDGVVIETLEGQFTELPWFAIDTGRYTPIELTDKEFERRGEEYVSGAAVFYDEEVSIF